MNNVSIIPCSDNWSRLSLANSIGIADANEMANLLREALPVHPRLRLDCRELVSIDTAILQLLLAARQSFAALVLHETSPAWDQAFLAAGFPTSSFPSSPLPPRP